MVHVIHVERVSQQALVLMGAGSGVTVQDALDEFDKALHDDPTTPERSEQADLRRALGV